MILARNPVGMVRAVVGERRHRVLDEHGAKEKPPERCPGGFEDKPVMTLRACG
jgi:hypothetical protein